MQAVFKWLADNQEAVTAALTLIALLIPSPYKKIADLVFVIVKALIPKNMNEAKPVEEKPEPLGEIPKPIQDTRDAEMLNKLNKLGDANTGERLGGF